MEDWHGRKVALRAGRATRECDTEAILQDTTPPSSGYVSLVIVWLELACNTGRAVASFSTLPANFLRDGTFNS